MAAVGETDPTFKYLQEALKKAKAQCQVRTVEDRTALSKELIDRVKKRIVACQAKVSQAQEALAKAQSKLQQEEQGFTDGEARLAILMQESAEVGPRVEEVHPNDASQLRPRACRMRACLSKLGERKFGLAFAIIVRSEWRGTRTQTAQKFGKFHSRFGAVESDPNRGLVRACH